MYAYLLRTNKKDARKLIQDLRELPGPSVFSLKKEAGKSKYVVEVTQHTQKYLTEEFKEELKFPRKKETPKPVEKTPKVEKTNDEEVIEKTTEETTKEETTTNND